MLRYKKIILSLLIYIVTLFVYLLILRQNFDFYVDFFYTNIMFFLILIILTNIFIKSNKNVELELYKYDSKIQFMLSRIESFTYELIILLYSILAINSVALLFLKSDIDLNMGLNYTIQYFFVFEILFLIINIFIYSKKYNFIRFVIVAIFIALFMLCTNTSSLNIFKYLLYGGKINDMLLFYFIYFAVVVSLLVYSLKRKKI